MKKFGAIDPKITPDVESPAQPCSRADCPCQGELSSKSAANENKIEKIGRLDKDFRRQAADNVKNSLE